MSNNWHAYKVLSTTLSLDILDISKIHSQITIKWFGSTWMYLEIYIFFIYFIFYAHDWLKFMTSGELEFKSTISCNIKKFSIILFIITWIEFTLR